jgi:Terminase large subunit, T4likevirus-type, N-terminal/Terminase RNaseH-like domain
MKINLTATKPQADFLALDCKFPAFIAGFGTGKSETMVNSALLDSIEGGSDSLIALYEPTYDLVRLILAPRMEQKLIDWGVRYKYNKTENIIYTSSGQLGDFVLRTLDNPARIVGYESFRAKLDEIDTLKQEHATEAWIKVIARNRQKPKTYQAISGKPINTVSVFSTPEGFRFVYDRWKKNPKAGYEMIQASTMSNPYLPDDYVQALRDSYPPQLIDAYLNGEFVNLTSGTVYPQFDRKLNHCNDEWDGREPVHIGMDFNVGKMSAILHVERDGEPRAVGEILGAYDTPEMIRLIKQRLWRELSDGEFEERCQIYVYPDASGNARKTVNASTSDLALLREAGFVVMARGKNPSVRDRITSVNAMLCNAQNERRYLINTRLCPSYTEAREQQVYNKNGEPDKSHDKDHPNDAADYYIHYAFPASKPSVGWVSSSR